MPKNSLDNGHSWIAENISNLGPLPIRDVCRILAELPAPFNKPFIPRAINNSIKFAQQYDSIAHATVPCFFDDPEYRRECARIVGYIGKNGIESRRTKRDKIRKQLDRLPAAKRREAQYLLRLCDEQARERIALEDCKIRWFKHLIAQEEALLKIEALLRNAQGFTQYSPTFLDKLGQLSIFPIPWQEAQDAQIHISRVNEHLRRAQALVDRASERLEPARRIYLSPHLPRAVKDLVLHWSSLLNPKNMQSASAFAAEFIALVDPKRPAKAPALRQRAYGR